MIVGYFLKSTSTLEPSGFQESLLLVGHFVHVDL